eukprot:TRINITY_DN27637_c0_g1_i1.p1 TRINITY_DN27637_c0_g1~~TRINITY_DN27637_c0_g1_i1.p1  ORF type:complete len:225 (-),score=17.77 TRINITY_DN27637_c0_g1_i1:76-750(-)
MAEALDDLFGDDTGAPHKETIVDGFDVWRNFASTAEQQQICDAITAHGWFNHDTKCNQTMWFGGIPPFTDVIANKAQQLNCLSAPLCDRLPIFDQCIINLYEPGEGIKQHVDLESFEDGIVGLSLRSAVVMDLFSKQSDPQGGGSTVRHVPVVLFPGDLYVMQGAGRYDWTHGIAERTVDEFGGCQLEREQRLSVTLRKTIPEKLKKQALDAPPTCPTSLSLDG